MLFSEEAARVLIHSTDDAQEQRMGAENQAPKTVSSMLDTSLEQFTFTQITIAYHDTTF